MLAPSAHESSCIYPHQRPNELGHYNKLVTNSQQPPIVGDSTNRTTPSRTNSYQLPVASFVPAWCWHVGGQVGGHVDLRGQGLERWT